MQECKFFLVDLPSFVCFLIDEIFSLLPFFQVISIKVCVLEFLPLCVCVFCESMPICVVFHAVRIALYSLSKLLGLVRISLANLQVCLAALSRAEWGLPWKRSRLGKK